MNKSHEAMQDKWRELFGKKWLFPEDGRERFDDTEYVQHFEKKYGRLKCFRGPETYTLAFLEKQQEFIVDTYQLFAPNGGGTWLRSVLQFGPTCHAIADLIWSAEAECYHCPLIFYVRETSQYHQKLEDFKTGIFDPSEVEIKTGFGLRHGA